MERTQDRRAFALKDQVLAIMGILIGTVAAAAVIKYSDLPTRVSIVETQIADVKADQADIKQTVHEILSRLSK